LIVNVTTTIECQVQTSNDAHSLGQELENRLVQAVSALLPNLRHAQQIQEGSVQISMKVSGRRLRIQNLAAQGQERLAIQGEGNK